MSWRGFTVALGLLGGGVWIISLLVPSPHQITSAGQIDLSPVLVNWQVMTCSGAYVYHYYTNIPSLGVQHCTTMHWVWIFEVLLEGFLCIFVFSTLSLPLFTIFIPANLQSGSSNVMSFAHSTAARVRSISNINRLAVLALLRVEIADTCGGNGFEFWTL